MRKPMTCLLSSVLVFGAVCVAAHAASPISVTQSTKHYSVTLKVLPAESFTGPKAEMVRDGGAKAVTLKASDPPNKHMVVFIKKQGKAVENAKVQISYARQTTGMLRWKALPIARMHVANKGSATTHFGNNVKLAPGKYEVSVTVNGERAPVFHITV